MRAHVCRLVLAVSVVVANAGLIAGPGQGATVPAARSASTATPPAVRADEPLAPTDPGTYAPLHPAEIVDTRTGVGVRKAEIGPERSVTFTLLGRGGVPSRGVSAVSAAMTASAPTATGNLIAYPAGSSRPAIGAVPFSAGRSAVNTTILRPGLGGRVTIVNGSAGPTGVIVVVGGYYNGGRAAVAGAFVAINPVRLLDTGRGVGAVRRTVAPRRYVRTVIGGRGGLPKTGIAAVAVDVISVGSRAAGYLTATDYLSPPVTTTLTFARGHAVGADTIVPVDPRREALAVFNGSRAATNVIIDVLGYFRAGRVSAPGAYEALTPRRLLDTRVNRQSPVGAKHAVEALPDLTALGNVGVVTVTAADGNRAGYLSVYGTNTPRPAGAIVDYTPKAASSGLAIVPTGTDNGLEIWDGSTGSVHIVVDLVGIYLSAGPKVDAVPDDGFSADQVACSSASFCISSYRDTDLYDEQSEVSVYDGSVWSTPHVDFFGYLSCLPTSVCLATGDVASAIATDGSGSWSEPYPAGFVPQGAPVLACATDGFCLVPGEPEQRAPKTARWDGTAFTTVPGPGHEINELSCGSTSCTGIDVVNGSTQSVTYTDGSGWAEPVAVPIAAEHLGCADTACLAVDDEAGAPKSSFLTSTGWSSPMPLPSGIDRVSSVACTTSTDCRALGFTGANEAVTATWDGATWGSVSTIRAFGTGGAAELACPTAGFCAASPGGALLTEQSGTWSAPAFHGLTTDVSCSTPLDCVAVDRLGGAQIFNGTTWKRVAGPQGLGDLDGVSCATVSFCEAVGTQGNQGVGSTWDGSGWSSPADLPGLTRARDVSCPTATSCLAVGDGPVGGVDAMFSNGVWQFGTSLGDLAEPQHLSCLRNLVCVASGLNSTLTYTLAGRSTTGWSAAAMFSPPTDNGPTPGAACDPQRSACSALVAGLRYTFDGRAWTSTDDVPPGSTAMSCPSDGGCVALLDDTLYSWDEVSWSPPLGLADGGREVITCPTRSFCVTA